MGWIYFLDTGAGGAQNHLWMSPPAACTGTPIFFSEKAEREHWLTHCEILFLYLEVVNYFI